MTTFKSGTKCPFCGANHDLATGVSDDRPPDDGSITLCVSCGEWSFFEASTAGGLRKPTDAEYGQIAETPLLRAARAAWVQATAAKAEKPKIKAQQEFQCDACGETYISGWSESDAEAEYRLHYGKPVDHDRAIVLCEDCYARAVAEMGKFESRH